MAETEALVTLSPRAQRAERKRRVTDEPATNDSEPQTNEAKRKRARKPRPVTVKSRVDQAAKAGIVLDALEAFDDACREETAINQHTYNVLLHLCAGGDEWESKVPCSPIAVSPKPDPATRGLEIFKHMTAAEVAPTEPTYTSLARMAALRGDPVAALEVANQALALGQPTEALAVHAAISAAGLESAESEYAHLLRCCAAAQRSEDVESLLRQMGTALTGLQESTVQVIEDWFKSDKTSPGGWHVERVTVGADGKRLDGKGPDLLKVDLAADEFETFSAGITKMAEEREFKKSQFKEFQDWEREHGPFDVLVDGANVAMFCQNNANGGFSYPQIKQVMDFLEEEHKGKKVLLLLHVRRLKLDCAKDPEVQEMIKSLKAKHMLYIVPSGSNDDWYWLYAAIRAGARGHIVSNDEMRDHIFALLSPRFFKRWKQHHQMKVGWRRDHLVVLDPELYTVCVQHLAGNTWMVPLDSPDGREWLCARPSTNVDGATASVDGDKKGAEGGGAS